MTNATPSPRALDADGRSELHHPEPDRAVVAIVELPSGAVGTVHTLKGQCRPHSSGLNPKLD